MTTMTDTPKTAKLYLARRHRGEHTVVTAIGAITQDTVIQLRSTLLQALARHSPHLILDLSATGVVDAVGADALRRTADRAERLGGRLHLVGPSPALRRQLHQHGLSWRLPIHTRLATALQRDIGTDGEAPLPDWLEQHHSATNGTEPAAAVQSSSFDAGAGFPARRSVDVDPADALDQGRELPDEDNHPRAP